MLASKTSAPKGSGGGPRHNADAAPAPAPDAAPPDAPPPPPPDAPPPPEPDAAAAELPLPPAPIGTEVVAHASGGQTVVFTSGAYTVRFDGPQRTFVESKYGITNTVLSTTWVRLLPAPFDGRVDADDVTWLEARAADDTAGVPDALAMAYQYIDGSPDRYEGTMRIAGDADYGSATGADFNDFLQIDWSYPAEGRDDPWDPIDAGNLDCSGFVRMIYGYRGGIPMSWLPQGGTTLPRQSANQQIGGTGVITIANAFTAVPASLYPVLEPGDLVFFDANPLNDGVIDHVGIFLGVDTAGNYRMINSRNSMLGPTMRDGAGSTYGESGQPSILNGGALYSKSFRTARRL